MKHILSESRKFFKNFPKRICNIVSYPQYLLFVIEIIIIIILLAYRFDKLLGALPSALVSIGAIVLTIFKFWDQKDSNYEHVWGQRNDTVEKVRNDTFEKLRNDTYEMIRSQNKYTLFSRIYFFTMALSFITIFYFINLRIASFPIEVVLFIACMSMMTELIIFYFSFLSISIIIFIWVIIALSNVAGSGTTLFNWTFLGLLFVNALGGNFFDKSLINARLSKIISESDLVLRKISYYIGMVFLYIGIYISNSVINSPFYHVFATSGQAPIIAFLQKLITKGLIVAPVFFVYMGIKNKIIYSIFRCFYGNRELIIRGNLVKLYLDRGIWTVVEKEVSSQDLNNLERISFDTFKIKGGNRNTYYVEQESEIHKRIEGRTANAGYQILGVTERDVVTLFWIIVTLCIIPVVSALNHIVKVDDGIYKVVWDRDDAIKVLGDAKVPNEIEVSGDAIVYNGKVEAYDKRTQSFEHGTISIRKVDLRDNNIYIVLTKNVGGKESFLYKK